MNNPFDNTNRPNAPEEKIVSDPAAAPSEPAEAVQSAGSEPPAVSAPVVMFSSVPLDDAADSQPFGPTAENVLTISVVDIQFRSGGKAYSFDPRGLTVHAGDDVIIDTAKGLEFAHCTAGNHDLPQNQVIQPLRPVVRLATQRDRDNLEENKKKEAAAFATCQKKIENHKLEMKLVSAEYNFDGSKILFYFTADGRVDFRELVRDLASVFRTRIELRQIGVRDEAKQLGGLGICGRPFCCNQFLTDFQPVSIKMAKTQSLSLNPTKISGTCGRLMCCLKYEQTAYEDLIKTSPKAESIVNTWDGKGIVTDQNLLKQTVKVRLDSQPDTIKCYHNCDVCVLRNGKGRKTDPPIPDDIPPLPKPKEVEVPKPEFTSSADLGWDVPAREEPEPQRQRTRRGRDDQKGAQRRQGRSGSRDDSRRSSTRQGKGAPRSDTRRSGASQSGQGSSSRGAQKPQAGDGARTGKTRRPPYNRNRQKKPGDGGAPDV